MTFSTIRSLQPRSIEAGILVLFAILTICVAGLLEPTSNETGERTTSDSFESTTSIPFPGTHWLDTMGSDMSNRLSFDGTLYSSAYDAFLYGDALSNPCRNVNAWVNSWLFGPGIAAKVIETTNNIEVAHYLLCYLRNFLGAMFIYYGVAGIFHYFCYVHPMSNRIFANRTRPTWETIRHQIKLSQTSITVYTLFPVVDECLVESGRTKVYFTIDEIGGWPSYIATMLVYFACVEVGIYWMHRTLHTNKTLYKYIHLKHHAYNKPETLTPWASIAFHPLDGILQACPYTLLLPLLPCHYLTHFGMLFFTAIWATYIHDAMDWNMDPIMGSKYHTVHHTHYIYNYGQVFIFCDWFWGTLKIPDGPTGIPTQRNRKKVL